MALQTNNRLARHALIGRQQPVVSLLVGFAGPSLTNAVAYAAGGLRPRRESRRMALAGYVVIVAVEV